MIEVFAVCLHQRSQNNQHQYCTCLDSSEHFVLPVYDLSYGRSIDYLLMFIFIYMFGEDIIKQT